MHINNIYLFVYLSFTHRPCSRYLAICHPLSLGARSSTGKAKRVVGAVWAGSFLSAAPWAYFTKEN